MLTSAACLLDVFPHRVRVRALFRHFLPEIQFAASHPDAASAAAVVRRCVARYGVYTLEYGIGRIQLLQSIENLEWRITDRE